MPNRRRIEVSAGVIQRDGRILITQRRPGDHLGLLWEFPGGKREAGEGWEECLRRELREELGVDVAVGVWLDAVTHEYEDRDVHLRFFRCRLAGGTPSPLHCHDLRWVEPRELSRFEFPEADAGLVRWLATSPGARPDPARVSVRRGVAGPARAAVDVPRGTHLDEAAVRCGIQPRLGCEIGECGACAVSVIAGAASLTSLTSAERAYFSLDATSAAGSRDSRSSRRASHPRRRLACQARITGNVSVAPEERALLHC